MQLTEANTAAGIFQANEKISNFLIRAFMQTLSMP